MDNVCVRTDPAGNIKMDKSKSTEKLMVLWQQLWHLIELLEIMGLLNLYMIQEVFYLFRRLFNGNI